MSVTQDQVTWFAHTFDQLAGNIERAVLGKQHVTRLLLTCSVEGHMLPRTSPAGQDAARALLPRRPGQPQPHPVHPRPAPERRHRRDDLRAEQAGLRVPPRPDLRHDRPRRRDQPRLCDPLHSSRSWRRAASRSTAPALSGRAVRDYRDAEPRRAGRHLPPPRGPARPLPDEVERRLPRPRGDHRRARRRQDPRPRQAALSRSSRATSSSTWPASPTRSTSTRRSSATSAASRRSRGGPVPQARTVGPRLPRLRPLRQDVARRDAPTSSPTTSRFSPSRCSRTACCSVPRLSSPGPRSTTSSTRSSGHRPPVRSVRRREPDGVATRASRAGPRQTPIPYAAGLAPCPGPHGAWLGGPARGRGHSASVGPGPRARVVGWVSPLGWAILALGLTSWLVGARWGWTELLMVPPWALVLFAVCSSSPSDAPRSGSTPRSSPVGSSSGSRATGRIAVTNEARAPMLLILVELPVGLSAARFVLPALAPGTRTRSSSSCRPRGAGSSRSAPPRRSRATCSG